MFASKKDLKNEVQSLKNEMSALRQKQDAFEMQQHAINETQKIYNDFLEKKADSIRRDIDNMISSYHEMCEKILAFNRELFIKDLFFNTTKDVTKELEEFKAAALKPLLQAKWDAEKNKNGHAIMNKGAAIIEERDRLHAEILLRERQGENVDKFKEQIKGFEWILSSLKD